MTAPALLEDTLAEMSALMGASRQLHVGASAKVWQGTSLTMAQVRLLMQVLMSGGLTSATLASQLGVRPSAVTPIVAKLVAQRLVRREADPDDRRVVWIRPTAKGTALFAALTNVSSGVFRSLLADVDDDDLATIHRAMTVLARIATAKVAHRTRGAP